MEPTRRTRARRWRFRASSSAFYRSTCSYSRSFLTTSTHLVRSATRSLPVNDRWIKFVNGSGQVVLGESEDMAKLADATLGRKTRCRKLLCTDPGHGIGDMMVPANGSKGPVVESIESCVQGLAENATIQHHYKGGQKGQKHCGREAWCVGRWSGDAIEVSALRS